MRFHSFVRTVLVRELIWRDPELHDDLHRRAAAIWADRGDVAEAHRLSVSIGDLAHAFTLVIAPTFDLINRGDAAGAARLMVSFPRDTDVDEPALALDMAVASFFARNHDEASRWSDRAAQLLIRGDPTAQVRLHALRGAALAHARRRGVSGGERGRVRPRGTARRFHQRPHRELVRRGQGSDRDRGRAPRPGASSDRRGEGDRRSDERPERHGPRAGSVVGARAGRPRERYPPRRSGAPLGGGRRRAAPPRCARGDRRPRLVPCRRRRARARRRGRGTGDGVCGITRLPVGRRSRRRARRRGPAAGHRCRRRRSRSSDPFGRASTARPPT